jgi:hypothetical protein
VAIGAGVATTMGAGVVIIMAVTTMAVEGITPEGSVRAVISPGMRLESIIPSTDSPGLVLYLGNGLRSLTLTASLSQAASGYRKLADRLARLALS